MLAPIVRNQKGEHKDLFIDMLKQGFTRARVDGETIPLTTEINLDRTKRHNVEVVVDRLTAGPNIRGRLSETVETALKLRQGHAGSGNPKRRVNRQPPQQAKPPSIQPPMTMMTKRLRRNRAESENRNSRCRINQHHRPRLFIGVRLCGVRDWIFATDATDVQLQ